MSMQFHRNLHPVIVQLVEDQTLYRASILVFVHKVSEEPRTVYREMGSVKSFR